MSFLDWFKRNSQKETATARAVTTMVPLTGASKKGTPIKALVEEGYGMNAVVYACVRQIASAAGGVPWVLYKRRGSTLDEIEDHPLLKLLRSPNPLQGQSAFIESVISFLFLTGNSYIEGVSGGTGPIRELYSLNPANMKVLPHPIHIIGGYEFAVGQNKTKFDANEILHQKLFNPSDDFYGLSPVAVAALAIDKMNQGDRWNSALMENMAVPSGAFVSKQRLTDEQFQTLKREVADALQGAKNARKPLVTDGDLEWKEMGLHPRDLDWIEGSKLSASQIAMIYNVPGELIGLQDATFENRKEARKALYTEVVIPALTRLRDGFNHWLTPRYGSDLFLDFDKDGIGALSEDMDSLWKRANESTFLSINEKRRMVGYEDDPNGDVVLVSVGQLPLDDASSFRDAPGADESTPAKSCSRDYPAMEVEGKAFSPADRKRYARINKASELARKTFEKKYEPGIKKLLESEAVAVAKAYQQNQNSGVAQALESGAKKWSDLLAQLHHGVYSDSAPRALAQLKSWEPEHWETKADALGEARDLFELLALDFAKENAALAVTNLSKGSKSAINKIIADATAEGLGIAEIATALRDRLADLHPARAKAIARTEVHNAQTFAQEQQIKALDSGDMEKGWFWSGVSRGEHSEVDGVWVAMDGFFIVGGSRMSRPGDSAGGPENVINCACGLVFRRKK